VLTNFYDSGGNLASTEGVKRVDSTGQNHRYEYLHNLFYDKFEQRVFVVQGNGVKTAYSYDASTRRLAALTVSCPPVRRAGLSSEQAVFRRTKPSNDADFCLVVRLLPVFSLSPLSTYD